MAAYFKLILILLSLLVCVNSWLTCKDTFCNRVRDIPEKNKWYTLDLASAALTKTGVEATLSISTTKTLKFKLEVVNDRIFHLLINDLVETTPARYKVKDVLDGVFAPLEIGVPTKNTTAITVTYGKIKAVITGNPFTVYFYNVENNQDQLVSIINPNNHLIFEKENNNFAIALDVTFPEAQRAYGIPEHADHLALRSTGRGTDFDPYRLFNVDYGRYRVKSTESLYGAVPVLYAHGTTHSSGVFWLNAAQTWIDIKNAPNQIDSVFMSESGVLEMFVFTGPTLKETVQQYAKLTGVAPLPQYFTLGYHQSRYSYMNEGEVKTVVQQFDKHNMSMDVVWLDIDYTEGYKYFTWDPKRFPNPSNLLKELAALKRKLVAIIDPHIKVEKGYKVHEDATKNEYYVLRDQGGLPYEGSCWPGTSSWLDFLNPAAFQYYADLYKTTVGFNDKNIHLWNDMNEPAVFYDDSQSDQHQYEKTIPGKTLHNGGVRHYNVHNIYGFYQTKATHQGLLSRNLNVRPFILTRSHFSGSQRYAAMWTGDNYASWEYLQISIPMCLTQALAGISFCGADVAGFGGIPDDELFQRWYQAGAWLPFYRGHSAIDVPRREPYLYADNIQNRVRSALHQRYAHLPVWYTLFREHEKTGEPVIRPIIYQYPTEVDAFSIDNEVLVGSNILAAPILQPGASTTSVYLPGGESTVWYNIDDNYKAMNGTGYHTLNVTMNSVPVFYKGGSIIPRKNTPRTTTVETYADPYTLYIALDTNNEAEGTLYVDDGESMNYQLQNKLEYLYIQLKYANNKLSSNMIDDRANYTAAADINQAIIINPPVNITGAQFTDDNNKDNTKISTSYSTDGAVLIIDNISAKLDRPFVIELTIKSISVTATLSAMLLIITATLFIII